MPISLSRKGMMIRVLWALASVLSLLFVPAADAKTLSRKGMMITPSMLSPGSGSNIMGPSYVVAPDWLPNPYGLGKYRIYFAEHHDGLYIRLAHNSSGPLGPWTVYAPGSLHASDVPPLTEVGFPDVHIDEANHKIVMYFRGDSPTTSSRTYRAESDDGVNFVLTDGPLGYPYFRRWEYLGVDYALDRYAYINASFDGGHTWTRGGKVFTPAAGSTATIRHYGVRVVGDELWVYWTKVGHAPERIFRSRIDMSDPGNWANWTQGSGVEILRPERDYEGADLPVEPSESGPSLTPENAVRDPFPFVRPNGEVYMFYAVKGEFGLALTRIYGE